MSRAAGVTQSLVLPSPPERYSAKDQSEMRRLIELFCKRPPAWGAVGSVPASVAALGALVGEANNVPYFTDVATMALASLTPYARTILACADAAAARTVLGLGGLAVLDAATEGDITLADVTTLDVSSSKHGLAPKAPGTTTDFLRGDGTWAEPSSAGSAAWTSDDSRVSPVSANALDDEFDGTAGAAIDAAWTAHNATGATAVLDGKGRVVLTAAVNSAVDIASWLKTPPATPWSIISRFAPVNNVATPATGLFVRNSTSGKSILFGTTTVGTYLAQIRSRRFNSDTSSSIDVGTDVNVQPMLGPTYFKITNDGTTLKFWLSFIGTEPSHWMLHSSDPLSSFLSSVDQIGIAVYSFHASIPGVGVFEFFRVTA